MPSRFRPSHGSIVTYVDRDAAIHRAVAVGSRIDDPQTQEAWFPLLRPDRVVTIVEAGSIVDIVPRLARESAAEEILNATCQALDTAMRNLADFTAPGAFSRARTVLGDFVLAIRPLERTLDILLELEPTGALASAVNYLVIAASVLDMGDTAAGRAAIRKAHVVLDDLTSG